MALIFIGICLFGSSISGFSQPAPLNNTSGFPGGSMVLLTNGQEKPIEQILPGDVLAAYDPVNEDFIHASVTKAHILSTHDSSLMTIMLVQEELSASLQVNGGTLGIILPVTPQQSILTVAGVKEITQLMEGDKVYCYNEAVHRFELFTVYALEPEKKFTGNIYHIDTDQGNYIVNGTVVMSVR